MAQLVCLANSIREGKRCVAGINLATGEWIRPVPPGGGGIPYDRTLINGQTVQLLDVVEIGTTGTNPGTRYQCENREVTDEPWILISKLEPRDIVQYCDATTPILHSNNDRVRPQELDELRPQAWTSLQLVQSHKLSYQPDPFKQGRWQAVFKANARSRFCYCLNITDPEATGRLRKGETLDPSSLLTVSLAEPWAPGDGSKEELCYKVVAAIIEPSVD